MLRKLVTVTVVQNCRQVSTNSKLSSEVVQLSRKEEYYKALGEGKEDDSKPADWDAARPFEEIPGPKPLPFIGNMWRFFPLVGNYYGLDLLQINKKLYEEYGPICTLGTLMGDQHIFLYDPADSEKVYRNEGPWPIRHSLPSFVRYRTEERKDVFQGVGGVLSVQGKDWFDIRSKINPILMQPRNVAKYVGVIDTIAEELVERMRYLASQNSDNEMPESFVNELYKWALESITAISLDKKLGCLARNLEPDSDPHKVINSVVKMFDLTFKLDVLPNLSKVYPTKDWKEFVENLDVITFTLLKYVHEAKEEITRNKNTQKSVYEKSVLEKLLDIDEKVALTTALDLMTAGIDTTGKTLAAALYFLAKHPDKQGILREELVKLLPTKQSKLNKESLKEISYLKAVIKETTRMAPIAIGGLRKISRDLVLGGYQVPKGTNVISENLVLSTSDEFVPEASKFIPERFLRTTTDHLSHKHINPFVHLPFGFGPRSCIGKRLANLELEVGIAKIIRNFELSWPHEDMVFETKLLHGVGRPLRYRIKEV